MTTSLTRTPEVLCCERRPSMLNVAPSTQQILTPPTFAATGGQSGLGHRVSAQSRLVRPVYDLRAEAKDDGENFLLLFGSNLILVQHIFKVPGHDFKITSSDAETMVRLLSGSANHFTRPAGRIAQ